MAAVLASGDGAVLSHRSATALWGIWGSGAGEIARHGADGRSRSHALHPPPLLDASRRRAGGRRRDPGHVRGASRPRPRRRTRARRRRRARSGRWNTSGSTARSRSPALLDRHPTPPGHADRRGLPRTVCATTPAAASAATSRKLFLPFLDAHRIPRPRLNAWLSVGDDRYQVDCLWPDAHLIGELDGFKSHGTKRAFRKDRKRDRRLGCAGYQRGPHHRRPDPDDEPGRRWPSTSLLDLQASVITYAPRWPWHHSTAPPHPDRRPSARASARCATRCPCRCATSPIAPASRRRCCRRWSAGRPRRRSRSRRRSPPASN